MYIKEIVEPIVAVVGAGSWGTTVAKLIAENLIRRPEFARRDPRVKLYVHNDDYNGRPLTEHINRSQQNPKYLPGVLLPDIIEASPHLHEVIDGASIVVLASPHAHVPDQCQALGSMLTAQQRAGMFVLSLSKGLWYDQQTAHLWRMTELAAERLALPSHHIGALSGPNVAKEIAAEHFTESVVASQGVVARKLFQALLERPYFAVRESTDTAGVEFGGALKNIVAIAAGIVDGYELGNNAKATLIRIGMEEMYEFAGLPDFATPPNRETIAGPAIIGDIMTTCYAGRNRKYGEMLGRAYKTGQAPLDVKSFSKSRLAGQVVEGHQTVLDVHAFLHATGRVADFPVFDMVFGAIKQGRPPMERFLDLLHTGPQRHSQPPRIDTWGREQPCTPQAPMRSRYVEPCV